VSRHVLAGRWLPAAALAATVLATAPRGLRADPLALPSSPEEIVLVGDSVTAGVHFLCLSDTSAAQGWAAQVLRRCGLPVPSTRLDSPYPLDHLRVTRHGAGFLGIRYLTVAVRGIRKDRKPQFREGEVRTIVAVPGQTLGNVLRQCSDDPGERATGWVFGALFLPEPLTAIETVERAANRPRWAVLSIGANDLLASFGIVGGATAPDPATFERDYRELTGRLFAAMHPESRPDQLLCLTVPEVTALPFLQPVPAGSRDALGSALPEGTMTSAFLIPYGRRRFEDGEVWTPAELDHVRELARGYDEAVRRIAAENGYSVVELQELLERLRRDPRFAGPTSPWFSPDLHHPSYALHAEIADMVVEKMCRIAGVEEPPSSPLPDPLPSAADLTEERRARAAGFSRVALLGLERGEYPPGPTIRASVDIGGLIGHRRAGSWSAAALIGVEVGPAPASTRWVSRLALQARTGVVWVREDDDFHRFPAEDSDVRLALAFEQLGHWDWARVETGTRWAMAGGLGFYTRGEWRKVYAELVSDGFESRRAELGVRFGGEARRPGRNGN